MWDEEEFFTLVPVERTNGYDRQLAAGLVDITSNPDFECTRSRQAPNRRTKIAYDVRNDHPLIPDCPTGSVTAGTARGVGAV